MNFETCEADVNLILNKHFTEGRSGATIDKIIVHYNAGNLTCEGCYSVWQDRGSVRALSGRVQREGWTARLGP